MNINPLIKHPMINAIFTTIMTITATYFGYEKVQEVRSKDVKVEVVSNGHQQHSHERHSHKDWTSTIQKESKEIVKENMINHMKNFH